MIPKRAEVAGTKLAAGSDGTLPGTMPIPSNLKAAVRCESEMKTTYLGEVWYQDALF
jgi:hypothetical protein